jgi:hypothetical protein
VDDESGLEQQIEELKGRLRDVRAVKHQICNELMGAIGHAELLELQPELSDAARRKVARIRAHCAAITDQAEQLARICTPD